MWLWLFEIWGKQLCLIDTANLRKYNWIQNLKDIEEIFVDNLRNNNRVSFPHYIKYEYKKTHLLLSTNYNYKI